MLGGSRLRLVDKACQLCHFGDGLLYQIHGLARFSRSIRYWSIIVLAFAEQGLRLVLSLDKVE